MNGSKAKSIRRHAKQILIDWLRTMVSDEEAKDITLDNFKDYLPKEKYVFANRKLLLSAYSFKWFVKKIKTKVRKENKDVGTIRFEELLDDGRG
jgi:hypothetical protein|tara:strand:+ start:49 stop:330 length:282 start_codon:yes stop_codon:yes gene_type:complete